MDEATREIHRNDYRAASIARVLAEVPVTLMARMLERLCAYLDGLRQIPAPKGTES